MPDSYREGEITVKQSKWRRSLMQLALGLVLTAGTCVLPDSP